MDYSDVLFCAIAFAVIVLVRTPFAQGAVDDILYAWPLSKSLDKPAAIVTAIFFGIFNLEWIARSFAQYSECVPRKQPARSACSRPAQWQSQAQGSPKLRPSSANRAGGKLAGPAAKWALFSAWPGAAKSRGR